jgi:diguanylate cyclase (GGDEF)-like protein
LIGLNKKQILKEYEEESYQITKKAEYLYYFTLIVLLICVIGIIFHHDGRDLRFYIISFVCFSFVLYMLKRGNLNKAVSTIVFMISLNILNDIMRFDFTSYEKIVETLMESFLSYIMVGLFATRKRHIIYTIVANTTLTFLHASLIYHFTYSNILFPTVGYKYFIGGNLSVILVGLVLWASAKINDEALTIVRQKNEMLLLSKNELENLVAMRTRQLEDMNQELSQKNKELLTLSMYDPLTGVFNRRKIMDLGKEIFNTCKENNKSLCIVILDIDNFKNINDTYGHGIGDVVIKSIATTCKNVLRKRDYFARIGGEEFLILLENLNQSQTILVLERLRKKIEQSVIYTSAGEGISVTISIGISTLSNGDDSLATIIHRADEALYLSKRNGRNQINFIASSTKM